MEILFYRYNSICEPDVLAAFEKLGLTVVQERTQMTEKDGADPPAECSCGVL